MKNSNESNISSSIAPWLSVVNGVEAIAFYKTAFGAKEGYRMEDPDGGVVVKLLVGDAEFWVSGGSKDDPNASSDPLGGRSLRMILTVADPDTLFEQALKAGASQVFPMGEEYGWRLGRLVDPFGLHWEIGHPLSNE